MGSSGIVLWLISSLSGLKEEDSSPTRNKYKVRSFQVALAAIYEHDKPIRSGKEAIEVHIRVVSPTPPVVDHNTTSCAVSASVSPTE